MEAWSQYQSVLQLAAGTNIGIAGLLTVYGAEFGREDRRINALVSSAVKFKDRLAAGDETRNRFEAAIAEANGLKIKAVEEETHASPLVAVGIMACMVAAIASLCLLVISSFQPPRQSSVVFLIAILVVVPPFAAAAVASSRYFLKTRSLRVGRQKIEDDLLMAAGRWLSRQAGGGNLNGPGQ